MWGRSTGTGGASAAWQAALSYRTCGIEVSGSPSTSVRRFRRGTMSGTEGSADVGAIVVRCRAARAFRCRGGRLFLSPGWARRSSRVLAKGHPNPEAGSPARQQFFAPHTPASVTRSVALDWKLSNWFGLGMSGLVGATTSRVHVRFAGNDAGDWGMPVLGASLFGEVDWR